MISGSSNFRKLKEIRLCRPIKQESALINLASVFPPREKNIAVNSAKRQARVRPRLLVIVVIRLAR